MNRDGSRAKFSSAQMADGKLLLRTLGRSHALRLFPLRERHDVPRAELQEGHREDTQHEKMTEGNKSGLVEPL
jgi:hypothetical protein